MDVIDDTEVELDLVSQFMRTISNRKLLTKIILVLLIIFLGLADFAIFVLKIMWYEIKSLVYLNHENLNSFFLNYFPNSVNTYSYIK